MLLLAKPVGHLCDMKPCQRKIRDYKIRIIRQMGIQTEGETEQVGRKRGQQKSGQLRSKPEEATLWHPRRVLHHRFDDVIAPAEKAWRALGTRIDIRIDDVLGVQAFLALLRLVARVGRGIAGRTRHEPEFSGILARGFANPDARDSRPVRAVTE